MKEDQEKWLADFRHDLEKLEKSYEPQIPNQHEIVRTLQQFKAKRKRAFTRELIIFIITAIFVLSTYMLLALKVTTLFIIIQVVAIWVIPIIVYVERRHRQKRERVIDYDI